MVSSPLLEATGGFGRDAMQGRCDVIDRWTRRHTLSFVRIGPLAQGCQSIADSSLGWVEDAFVGSNVGVNFTSIASVIDIEE